MRRLDHYEIVVPRTVDSQGNFISHNVRKLGKTQKPEKSSLGENDLHYELSAFGRKFQFQLTPNKGFLAPGFVIESDNSIHTRQGARLRQHLNCHYVGKLKNESNSWLAMSTCNGLVSTE